MINYLIIFLIYVYLIYQQITIKVLSLREKFVIFNIFIKTYFLLSEHDILV